MVQKPAVTIVIPVYNEEKSIADTVSRVKKALAGKKYEIICVNDGSSDNTAKILKGIGEARTITHPYNLGYGAAIKTGIRNAAGEWILITDADGTYPIEAIPELISHTERYDMVVGARSARNVPLMRRPAKAILTGLANILTGRKIPDLNSGFRIFRKDMAERFYSLYPSGFSFTTTITLAAMTNDYTVKYVPIEYYTREGKSSIRPLRDFVGFLTLIFRIMIYFEPLRFFLLPSILLITLGIAAGVYEYATIQNVAELPVTLFLAGLQIGFIGLLADLMARKR